MAFDDLTYVRSLMAEREREAASERIGRLARIARAAADCCTGRLWAFRQRFSPTVPSTFDTCEACTR